LPVADHDLGIIGRAVGDDLLVTGGFGRGAGTPSRLIGPAGGLLATRPCRHADQGHGAPAAVLAGSCFRAADGSADAAFRGRIFHLDTEPIARGEAVVGTTALGLGQGTSSANAPSLLWASDTAGRG